MTTLLTIRKPRKANLRNNMKIMKKPYYLVNQKSGDKVIVHPPKSMRPGPLADGMDAKDEHGRWQRRFTVMDFLGQKGLDKVLILKHFPGEVAYYEDEKQGVKWKLEAIPDVHAEKKRGIARKGFRTRTSGGRVGAPAPKKKKAVARTKPQQPIQMPQPQTEPAAPQATDREPEKIKVVPTAGTVNEGQPKP